MINFNNENLMKKSIAFLFFVISSFLFCRGQSIDKSVVKDFDISRYLGKWYEIARYDHFFERGLVGVTADYSLRSDGKIKVVNVGYKDSLAGKKSVATGKAKIPDISVPSKLKVSFFWIFYSDYLVLELDSDYKWVVVGSSSDSFLWILSRTPQMEDSLYNHILEKIEGRGYDVSKLLKVKQK